MANRVQTFEKGKGNAIDYALADDTGTDLRGVAVDQMTNCLYMVVGAYLVHYYIDFAASTVKKISSVYITMPAVGYLGFTPFGCTMDQHGHILISGEASIEMSTEEAVAIYDRDLNMLDVKAIGSATADTKGINWDIRTGNLWYLFDQTTPEHSLQMIIWLGSSFSPSPTYSVDYAFNPQRGFCLDRKGSGFGFLSHTRSGAKYSEIDVAGAGSIGLTAPDGTGQVQGIDDMAHNLILGRI